MPGSHSDSQSHKWFALVTLSLPSVCFDMEDLCSPNLGVSVPSRRPHDGPVRRGACPKKRYRLCTPTRSAAPDEAAWGRDKREAHETFRG